MRQLLRCPRLLAVALAEVQQEFHHLPRLRDGQQWQPFIVHDWTTINAGHGNAPDPTGPEAPGQDARSFPLWTCLARGAPV